MVVVLAAVALVGLALASTILLAAVVADPVTSVLTIGCLAAAMRGTSPRRRAARRLRRCGA